MVTYRRTRNQSARGKRFFVATLIVGLAALAALTGCGGTGASSLTIGLTYVPNIQFAPFYVAVDAGYYEDEGLDITLRHHGQDEDLFGALTQAKEDVVVAGGAEMIQAHTSGIDAVTFATLYSTYPVAVIVPTESELETVEDLRGTKLGIPGRFGETWFGTLAFLHQAGLTEDDVDITEIGFTQQAALASGHVDAVVGFANNDVPQFRATGLDVRALPNDPIPVVGVGLGATSATIADDPDSLTKIFRATKRAVVDIVADPQVAVDAARNHLPGTLTVDQEEIMIDVVTRTVTLYGDIDENWGTPNLATWEAMNAFMVSVELIDSPVSLTDVVTNDITTSH